MKDDLDQLYNPSIQDLELDEHQGVDRPVIYLDSAKEVISRKTIEARIDEAQKALHIMASQDYGDLLKRDTLDQVRAQDKRIKQLEATAQEEKK